MKTTFIFLLGVVSVILMAGCLTALEENGGEVACTLDAKICPDGSVVGRVAPSCEFEACPVGDETDSGF